jgi:hypothetical protein
VTHPYRDVNGSQRGDLFRNSSSLLQVLKRCLEAVVLTECLTRRFPDVLGPAECATGNIVVDRNQGGGFLTRTAAAVAERVPAAFAAHPGPAGRIEVMLSAFPLGERRLRGPHQFGVHKERYLQDQGRADPMEEVEQVRRDQEMLRRLT